MSQIEHPQRKILVPILERRITQHQLDGLRSALNHHQLLNIELKNSGIGWKDGNYLFNDFAIEADESDEATVRTSMVEAGLTPAHPLHDNSRIREDVRRLVAEHAKNDETPLRFAIWFRRHDPSDIFLMEIADGVFDPGTGELEGIGMNASAAIRGVRLIVLYLVSPAEVHKAFEVNPTHPAIQAIYGKEFDLLFPDSKAGGWDEFIREFPEIERARG